MRLLRLPLTIAALAALGCPAPTHLASLELAITGSSEVTDACLVRALARVTGQAAEVSEGYPDRFVSSRSRTFHRTRPYSTVWVGHEREGAKRLSIGIAVPVENPQPSELINARQELVDVSNSIASQCGVTLELGRCMWRTPRGDKPCP
jgi:hypothetical protein